MELTPSKQQVKPLNLGQYVRHKKSGRIYQCINNSENGFVRVQDMLKGSILRDGLGIDMDMHKIEDFDRISPEEAYGRQFR